MLKVFEGIPKKRIVVDMLCTCIWSIFNCYFVTLLAQLTESVLNDNEPIIKLLLFFLIYIFLWELTEYVSDVHSDMTSVVIENNVQSIYFNKVYFIKPSVLKANNTGYISGLLTKLIHLQAAAYSQIVIFLPLALVYVLYFIWQLGEFHYLFGLALFALITIAVLIRIVGNNLVIPRIHDLSVAEANRNKLIVDTVTNVGTIQKMQASSFVNEKMNQATYECSKKAMKYFIQNELFFCAFKFLVYSYVPVCLFIYYFFLNETLENSNAFFSLLAVVAIQIVHVSKNIATAFSRYTRFKGTREKLDEIINNDNVRQNLETEGFNNADIKELDYTYQNDYTGNKIHIQIPGFHIEKGDMICVHGESGQGKTTLLHLLSSEIESNGVYLNGKKTNKRLECVFIAQDTEILDMTIRDNLTLGNKNISDDTLIQYLDLVGLHDWFVAQEKRLDTILGERGVFVSTGQRQRLNLIRGLLIKDKEIYLLDEPTSNVDEQTEEEMISLIQSALKDKTVVIVTHRPKIKSICNHSYVFQNGVLKKEY